jgi:NADH-quinone oxidoreductase subunit G
MDIGATTDGGVEVALDGADVVYNLGADECEVPKGAFVIYQGSHGDKGAHRADVIMPAAAYTEENGVFVNTEGRSQMAFRAGFAPGDAKENWAILRALSAELGSALPYDSLAQLRQLLLKEFPNFGRIDVLLDSEWDCVPAGKLTSGDFTNAIPDFYMSNPIARASTLMAELSAGAKSRNHPKMAAE